MARREDLHRLVRDFRNYVEFNTTRSGMRPGSLPAPDEERSSFEADKRDREARRVAEMRGRFDTKPSTPATRPARSPSAPQSSPSSAPASAPQPQAPSAPARPRAESAPVPSLTAMSEAPERPAVGPAPTTRASSASAPWMEFGSRPQPMYSKAPVRKATAQEPRAGASEPPVSRSGQDEPPFPPGPPPEAYEGGMNASGPPQDWAPPPQGDMSAAQKRDGKAWHDETLPAAAKLKLLRELIGDCQRCGLCKSRTNIVFGEGSTDARLMFIGEAPSYNEDKQARPFVGESGALLDRMVKAMGFERDEIYVANVLKCSPPKDRDPSMGEVTTCTPFILQQIQAIQPDVIVALGRFAANTLLDRQGSEGKIRGVWQDFQGIPVMPTYHPAHLLRTPEAKRLAWEDLQKVMEKLK